MFIGFNLVIIVLIIELFIYATKQLHDGELIRRVCDDWNYNSTNSYTPNDLRHGPITVWPQGSVTPAMRASYGDLARFWSSLTTMPQLKWMNGDQIPNLSYLKPWWRMQWQPGWLGP